MYDDIDLVKNIITCSIKDVFTYSKVESHRLLFIETPNSTITFKPILVADQEDEAQQIMQ